ncbi:MAG: HRDC domain-containing protein [Bacteroidetes bacterium]|nr:HRDC domain-containing protein [Bacteroidota bacterium]
MEYRQNEQLLLATEFVQCTNKNIFLTGKAGTGKTTFLHNLKKITPKRMVVVAPTGVAAINAGGVTIHSFFQLSFAPAVPASIQPRNASHPGEERFQRKFNREKIRLIKCIDLLVIDEISMVRADILDAIDEVLRKYRNHYLPFGGVQLLMIGDLHQLSPVIKETEWSILRNFYESAYFFDSHALKKTNPVTIELKEIFRQSDSHFIGLLNKVRENTIDRQTITELNTRYIPGFNPGEAEGYITLTTHNANAYDMNQVKLKSISGPSQFFQAEIEDDFPPHDFPTEEQLELRPNAQVMFIKNDLSAEKQYYNGKIGKITRMTDELVFVKCPSDDAEIAVGRVRWENVKYTLDESTKEIKENIVGSFTQVPLKLAWAITIHKSQGLTFDKVIIDANSAFAFGQVYVALSRCRTFTGIVLSTPIAVSGIKTDALVLNYSHEAQQQEPGPGELFESKFLYQKDLFFELFDFKLTRYRFETLLKLVRENPNILDPSLITNLLAMKNQCDATLFEVAEKFKVQLSNLMKPLVLPENNDDLQERTRQAVRYFSTTIKTHLSGSLGNLAIDTDNKAVKKLLTEAAEKLQKEVFIRLSCLENCKLGFETISYIKMRSNADVDFRPSVQQKTQFQQQSSKSIPHPELYAELRKWRDNLADERDIPKYMVLPQKSMLDLMQKLPATLPELKTIKGIGQAKINQFGEEIITIINTFCSDHDIVPAQIEIPAVEKKAKVNSGKLSFEMFRAGKTVAEIAALRSLSTSTVEGHLAPYVGTGDLMVSEFVHAEKLNRVLDYISANPHKTLGEVKSAMGDTVTYADLKFIFQHLSHLNS